MGVAGSSTVAFSAVPNGLGVWGGGFGGGDSGGGRRRELNLVFCMHKRAGMCLSKSSSERNVAPMQSIAALQPTCACRHSKLLAYIDY